MDINNIFIRAFIYAIPTTLVIYTLIRYFENRRKKELYNKTKLIEKDINELISIPYEASRNSIIENMIEIENILNILYKKYNDDYNIRLTLYEKIDRLYKNNIIKIDIYEMLNEFRMLRNRIAHDVNVGETISKMGVVDSIVIKKRLNELLDKTYKVFIASGKNNVMKHDVIKELNKMGLETILIEENISIGKSIIEKFEDHSDVCYALFLLSHRDLINNVNNDRSLQNILIELGWFMGKLGKNRVAVIIEKNTSNRLLSDIGGILYIPYDNDNNWVMRLQSEFNSCGIRIQTLI